MSELSDDIKRKIERLTQAAIQGDMAHMEAMNKQGTATEIYLQRETVGSMYVIPMELVEEMAGVGNFDQLRVYMLDMANQLAIQVRKYIWKEHLGTEEIEIPNTWWDHFKQDYFPEWLLERFPVKYIKFKYEFDLLYPGIVADRSKGFTVIRHIS